MKKAKNAQGAEYYCFGAENKLQIFPPNSYNFKPKDHIAIDEVQQCILDNFWYQYNNKREEKGYMLSILNSLAEYFNRMNILLPITEVPEDIEPKALYVLYDGKAPGIYTSFEEIISQKRQAKLDGGISWKKYDNAEEALAQARKILGVNYHIEPAAKEYIQKRAKSQRISAFTHATAAGESSTKATYKDCLGKGTVPIDGSYIQSKIEEHISKISPLWKKEMKEELLRELTKELDEKFENMKREYEDRLNISISDDDMLDIAGHGQRPE